MKPQNPISQNQTNNLISFVCVLTSNPKEFWRSHKHFDRQWQCLLNQQSQYCECAYITDWACLCRIRSHDTENVPHRSNKHHLMCEERIDFQLLRWFTAGFTQQKCLVVSWFLQVSFLLCSYKPAHLPSTSWASVCRYVGWYDPCAPPREWPISIYISRSQTAPVLLEILAQDWIKQREILMLISDFASWEIDREMRSEMDTEMGRR